MRVKLPPPTPAANKKDGATRLLGDLASMPFTFVCCQRACVKRELFVEDH